MATLYRFSWWTRLRHVHLPQLAPYFAVAARSGLAIVWKIVLIVELLGLSSGVGFKLNMYFQYFDVTGILAYALSFIAVIFVIEAVLSAPLADSRPAGGGHERAVGRHPPQGVRQRRGRAARHRRPQIRSARGRAGLRAGAFGRGQNHDAQHHRGARQSVRGRGAVRRPGCAPAFLCIPGAAPLAVADHDRECGPAAEGEARCAGPRGNAGSTGWGSRGATIFTQAKLRPACSGARQSPAPSLSAPRSC